MPSPVRCIAAFVTSRQPDGVTPRPPLAFLGHLDPDGTMLAIRSGGTPAPFTIPDQYDGASVSTIQGDDPVVLDAVPDGIDIATQADRDAYNVPQ